MDETAAEHDVVRRVFEACLERAPRPEPDWEADGRRPRAHERRGRARPFPLVPRPALRRRAVRRPRAARGAGSGDEIAGYASVPPGRPPGVDRLDVRPRELSAARGGGRVRRARVLRRGGAARRRGRRPAARGWRSTPTRCPWLDKAGRPRDGDAELIAASDRGGTRRARRTSTTAAGRPFWLAPRAPGLSARRCSTDRAGSLRRAGRARSTRPSTLLERHSALLPAGHVRLRPLGLPRRPCRPGVGPAARAALGRDAGRRPGPRLGAELPRRRRRRAAGASTRQPPATRATSG